MGQIVSYGYLTVVPNLLVIQVGAVQFFLKLYIGLGPGVLGACAGHPG